MSLLPTPLITPQEIFDLVIMTLAVGFIFKDYIKAPAEADHDPLAHYTNNQRFFSKDFMFAVLVTAPAIILHEMGHKFVAIAYGIQATFHASYTFLGLGVLLKLLKVGFIFFVPGYVTHSALIPPLHTALIAIAGPGINALLWGGSKLLLKYNVLSPETKKKWSPALFMTARINMFLFFFNMLPLPIFDGGHFFGAMIKVLF
jgi:Zn-dependent protease